MGCCMQPQTKSPEECKRVQSLIEREAVGSFNTTLFSAQMWNISFLFILEILSVFLNWHLSACSYQRKAQMGNKADSINITL